MCLVIVYFVPASSVVSLLFFAVSLAATVAVGCGFTFEGNAHSVHVGMLRLIPLWLDSSLLGFVHRGTVPGLWLAFQSALGWPGRLLYLFT